jgi:hypothetical protein
MDGFLVDSGGMVRRIVLGCRCESDNRPSIKRIGIHQIDDQGFQQPAGADALSRHDAGLCLSLR